MEWLTIESAPKDGTRVLVIDMKSYSEFRGPAVAGAGWCNDTPDDIRWEVVNDIVIDPTHWMPLPNPPKE